MEVLFKNFLALRKIEYLTLDRNFLVIETTENVHRFSEDAKFFRGNDCFIGLPELVGMELDLIAVIDETKPGLILQSIARFSEDATLMYFNLYILKIDKGNFPGSDLILFFEDISERMNLEQCLVQASNEMGLLINALNESQNQSERLLLNILPASISDRLKHETGTIADHFSEVTVLFADLVGFTEIAVTLSPVQLVNLLNQIFSEFDHLTELHGLEKIKTIGDAYMVVGGLPMPRADHAQAIANMALDMQTTLDRFNRVHRKTLKMRIGIHSGPVIAGVIGIKKFIYDLWGDTVNIASRMESHGLPGQIQVTLETRDRLYEKYLFAERGSVNIKGKGEMITYWLTGKKLDCSDVYSLVY
jgi:class 3 adenylate cyclase